MTKIIKLSNYTDIMSRNTSPSFSYMLLGIFLLSNTLVLGAKDSTQPQSFKAISTYGTPKYKEGFKHFHYVNPNAPKGGSLKIGAIGVFDNLNPYSFKGIPAAGLGVMGPSYIYDYLMIASSDEPESLYGLVAERFEMPKDRSSMTLFLDKRAKFADGKPITTGDVKFTIETIKEHGRPFIQSHYKKIEKIEILSPHKIKLSFKAKTDEQGSKYYEQDLPLIIGRLVVMSKHTLEGKDFSNLSLGDLNGSGPFKVKSIDMGRSITFERRDDYWAKDHPVRKGMYNFDEIIFEYYRDNNVMFEAFKAGQFDTLIESNPKRWATQYDFKAVKNGDIKKIEYKHKRPVGFRGFVMNTRKDIFKDKVFRKALIKLFDFNWVNKNLYNSAFDRSKSYFENTDLAASGLPSDEELKILQPLKDKISEDVFTKEYTVMEYNDQRAKRKMSAEVLGELKEAGYKFIKGKLIHPKTKKPIRIELMVTMVDEEKLGLALKRDLKPLGVEVVIKNVDTSQYWARTSKFDFDMVIFMWSGSLSPSGGVLLNRWGKESRDKQGSLNYMGVKNPAIDKICAYVNQAKSRDQLRNATKALDRVLLWGHYVIPLFHDNKNRVAVRDKISHPPFDPLLGISSLTWWSKANKAPAF